MRLASLEIFEIILFQARYQFNDIRDVVEDEEHGESRIFKKLNPLEKAYDGSDIPMVYPGMKYHVLKISGIFVAIRVIASVMFGILFGYKFNDYSILWLIAITIIITILYELSREEKKTNITVFLIGSGYALRFFIGIYAALAESDLSLWNIILQSSEVKCLALSLWMMGIFACTLSWVNRAWRICNDMDITIDSYIKGSETRIKEYKVHFQRLLKSAVNINDSEDNELKLNNVKSIWNIMFIASLFVLLYLLWKIVPIHIVFRFLITFGTLICIYSSLRYSNGKKFLAYSMIGLALIFIGSMIYYLISENRSFYNIFNVYWITIFLFCGSYIAVRLDIFNSSLTGKIKDFLESTRELFEKILYGRLSYEYITDEHVRFDEYYVSEGVKKGKTTPEKNDSATK